MTKKNPFLITENKNNGFGEIIIRNTFTNEFVSIIPEYGARIKELWLNNGVETISILKTVPRIDSINRDDIFTNAKLSPFAGRIKDGEYTFNHINYNLPTNYAEEKNACHGFLYNKNFNVVDSSIKEEFASLTMEYFYNNELDGYPFSYIISITYKLTLHEGLVISTRVKNLSYSTIPISDGWHLYFDLGVKVDELKLKLDVSDNIEFDTRNVPNGNRYLFNDFDTPRKIGSRQLDCCFQVNNSNRIVTHLICEKINLDLQIWQNAGLNKYNFLVAYIPPDRKSIAIEPITYNINSFNNGEGIVLLEPQGEFAASFGITAGISEILH